MTQTEAILEKLIPFIIMGAALVVILLRRKNTR
jgi:hypothetical protein